MGGSGLYGKARCIRTGLVERPELSVVIGGLGSMSE
jgi:hypothetical protein